MKKHEKIESPIELEVTDANRAVSSISKNMGYFHKTPKSELMSYDQFVKASGELAPTSTKEEQKNKLK
jgi:hypothetical protein